MKYITILVPCYNEEESIPIFYKRVSQIIGSFVDINFDFLFVNDGSRDSTLAILEELSSHDARVHYIDLSRNYGKEIAMIAGIDAIASDAMIIMDADLQDPPELIPELVNWWLQGYQDVYAKRRSRDGETWFKKWSSHQYYKLLQRVTRIPIQQDVGDFRLLDRVCIDALKQFRESQRYTKGFFSWIGFKKKEVLFDREPRVAGETKWNYTALVGLAIDGITSFTIMPLRIATFLGFTVSFFSLLYIIYIFLKTLIYGDPVSGYPSLMSVILFLGGGQFMLMGVIGEYLGRTFNESKHRPLYFIQYKNF